jgi:hypothetical protein
VKALLWVLVLLLAVFIEAEVIAWCRPIQRWLIRRVAAPLPRQHRDRYIEEWYRELEEIPNGPVTRLVWILSLLLRRRSVARALGGKQFLKSSGALVFTKPYVKHTLLSKKEYGQGTTGIVTRLHTGLLGRIRRVDVRLADGTFVRDVPLRYFRA